MLLLQLVNVSVKIRGIQKPDKNTFHEHLTPRKHLSELANCWCENVSLTIISSIYVSLSVIMIHSYLSIFQFLYSLAVYCTIKAMIDSEVDLDY